LGAAGKSRFDYQFEIHYTPEKQRNGKEIQIIPIQAADRGQCYGQFEIKLVDSG
jgi:hypothetical protein